MKQFMDKDFLLNTETAKHLFFDIAKDLPIYDYHCHLNPKDIYDDVQFENITELWLGGDHYKWRQMRICGIDESLITGKDTSPRDKFRAFASIMPYIIGNPLYHWAHLELQRFFDIYTPLSSKTADAIYDEVEAKLKSGKYSARQCIEMSNVKVVCTTDDPIDDLKYHKALKNDSAFKVKVLPTFRPDKALNIELDGFKEYINKLCPDAASASDVADALKEKMDNFASCGCVISDHAFLSVPYMPCDKSEADEIFRKKMSGKEISDCEAEKYKTYIFLEICEKYYELDWAVQIHIGALRNNNTPMFNKLGPDTGYDSIDDGSFAKNLSALLNAMHTKGKLPKVIMYSLQPRDNFVLSTMIGNFSGETKGRIQFGSAWWFNDHYEGMTRHFKDLASLSSIGTFVGMLTDSRSFTSYTRHEYFRRIICNIIGDWVESGQYPNDEEALSTVVRGICSENIKEYLRF